MKSGGREQAIDTEWKNVTECNMYDDDSKWIGRGSSNECYFIYALL